MIRRLAGTLFLMLLLTAGPSTAETAPTDADAPLLVFTVNYPLRYLAERIGGTVVDVHFPVPAKVDPAFWSPDAEAIAAYQRADLILLNGARYARWTERASLPLGRLVYTASAIHDRLIAREDTVTHTHGPTGAHTHGELAFTTWLDPALARAQAREIHAAFRARRPDAAATFDAGLAALERDLDALDTSLRAATTRTPAPPLLASHPVYQYLARAYGLDLESVHFEPDQEPDAKAWQELTALHERHPAAWMLWEDEPRESTRARLAALGIESIVFDSCAQAPAEGDYLTVMRANVERLRRAYGNS